MEYTTHVNRNSNLKGKKLNVISTTITTVWMVTHSFQWLSGLKTEIVIFTIGS